MALRAAGHHIIGTSTPSEAPVAVGYIWSDTSANTLKICTSISPYTFASLGGSGAPADAQYLVAAANGDLTAERVTTDTSTISWDHGTAAQAKANVVDGSITYAKIQDVSATDKLLGRSTAGAGDVEEIACTAAGRALLDDAAASNQRTTLGLGTIATQDANSVSISGGSVTGITDLAIADGGTGQSTATAAFDALAPTTTQGDIIYYNGTDNVRLAAGTSGQFLKTQGAGANPVWAPTVGILTQSGGDSGGFAPAANTSYYMISDGVDPSTVASAGGVALGVTVPVSGTITKAYVQHAVFGTNGTNGENIVYRLRKNDTTDSDIIASLDTDTDGAAGSNAALGFAVSAGDVVLLKMTTPVTFSPLPTVMFILGVYVLETP